MAEKHIYHVQDLHKFYGQIEVIKGINLTFLGGAKIGVIGPNGAGKSTLLRIMSGEDTDFEGEAKALVNDLTVGYLPQEPPLNEDKDVAGNLEEAVEPIRDLIRRYEAISEKFGEVNDDDEMTKLLNQQQRLQDEIDHRDAWELDSILFVAETARNHHAFGDLERDDLFFHQTDPFIHFSR